MKNGYLFASELRDRAGLPPESSCPVETKFMFEDALIVRTGHRCPGEKLAVTALSTTVAAMSRPEVQISSDKADTTSPMDTMLTCSPARRPACASR